jgi:hypothetical protein
MPHFFATETDLLPVFSMVEAKRCLSYTLMGHIYSPKIVSFNSGCDLPTLSLPAPEESAIVCPAYLVTEAEQAVTLRELSIYEGRRRWAVDQLENPDSTGIWHGGVYENGVLLYGRVATCSKSKIAQSLQRAFAAAIRKKFVKVRAFYVGPEASGLLDTGWRLTGAKQSPPEYDLRR